MSTRKKGGKSFLEIWVDVGVKNSVDDYVSWYCVKGFTYVDGGNECSVGWFRGV